MTIDLDKMQASLQAVADAVHPTLGSKVRVESRVHRIFEGDARKGHEGENRVAIRASCGACGATGEVPDPSPAPTFAGAPIALPPVPCTDCDGRGEIHEDPSMGVVHVVIDIGQATHCEFSLLTADGIAPHHKGRFDLHPTRGDNEIQQLVRHCVGSASWESAMHDAVALDRAHVLLDAAAASGSFTADQVAHRRAHVVAKHAKGGA